MKVIFDALGSVGVSSEVKIVPVNSAFSLALKEIKTDSGSIGMQVDCTTS